MGKTVQKPRGNVERQSNSESSKYRSICSTCNHAPTCSYQKDPDRPVMQCEEFENYAKPIMKTAGKNVTGVPGLRAKSDAIGNSSKFRGLCEDCENRETCLYAKPEEGVWHCAEYQ